MTTDCEPDTGTEQWSERSSRSSRSPTASGCEPYRDLIELGLARGRNARAIWQDLVCQRRFASGYESVEFFVRRLCGSQVTSKPLNPSWSIPLWSEVTPEPTPQVPVVLFSSVVEAATPEVRGVGFRQVPKWRMQCGHERADDSQCETCQSVPREYLVLDPKCVQARVNGFGVNANIPGIEVWMDCETSVRRKP